MGGSVVPGPGVVAGGVVLTGGADAGAPEAVVPFGGAEGAGSAMPERGTPTPESEVCAHATPDTVSMAAKRPPFRDDQMLEITRWVFMRSLGSFKSRRKRLEGRIDPLHADCESGLHLSQSWPPFLGRFGGWDNTKSH